MMIQLTFVEKDLTEIYLNDLMSHNKVVFTVVFRLTLFVHAFHSGSTILTIRQLFTYVTYSCNTHPYTSAHINRSCLTEFYFVLHINLFHLLHRNTTKLCFYILFTNYCCHAIAETPEFIYIPFHFIYITKTKKRKKLKNKNCRKRKTISHSCLTL